MEIYLNIKATETRNEEVVWLCSFNSTKEYILLLWKGNDRLLSLGRIYQTG